MSQPVPTCSTNSSLYSCSNTKHDNLNITKFWNAVTTPIYVATGLLHLSAAWIQIIPAVNNLTKRMEIGHHRWTEIICFQSGSQNSCTLNTHFSTPKHLARNFSFTNHYFNQTFNQIWKKIQTVKPINWSITHIFFPLPFSNS